jgi:hypothetical protein
MLKEGRRDDITALPSHPAQPRKTALRSLADTTRFQRLGTRLINLRNKLARGIVGHKVLEKWRKFNAATAVAILIQKIWRAYLVRGSSKSLYLNRIRYYEMFRINYYHLARYLRVKYKRMVFHVLKLYHEKLVAFRHTRMDDVRRTQAILLLKDRLIASKWRRRRLNRVAWIYRQHVICQMFWGNLKKLSTLNMTVSAARHFAEGRVLAAASHALKKFATKCIKERHIDAFLRTDRINKTYRRLRRWVMFMRYRKYVYKNMRALLKDKKRRTFRRLRESTSMLMKQNHVLHDVAKVYRTNIMRSVNFHHFFIHVRQIVTCRMIGRTSFLRVIGSKYFTTLRDSARRKVKLGAIHQIAHGTVQLCRMRFYLKVGSVRLIKCKRLIKQLYRISDDRRSERNLRLGFAAIRRYRSESNLRHLLDSLKSSKASNITSELNRFDRVLGIRSKSVVVSPTINSAYIAAVASHTSAKTKKQQRYFDRILLDKLSISGEFWAQDDPRRAQMLHVVTPKHDIVCSQGIRRLFYMTFKLWKVARKIMDRASSANKYRVVQRSVTRWYRHGLRCSRRVARAVRVFRIIRQRALTHVVQCLAMKARLGVIKRTFYAVRRLRVSIHRSIACWYAYSRASLKAKAIQFFMIHTRNLRIALTILRENIDLKAQAKSFVSVARRHHATRMLSVHFFAHMKVIIHYRRKMKRIARKFYLRHCMHGWVSVTASAIGLSHLESRVRYRSKMIFFGRWLQNAAAQTVLRMVSAETQRRHLLIVKKARFVNWIEAIENVHMKSKIDHVVKMNILCRKKRVLAHWGMRCHQRDVALWTKSKSVFNSMLVFTAWQKHQTKCVGRAMQYHDRLLEVTLFRKMLFRHRVNRRLRQRATQGHDFLVLSEVKHAVHRWRWFASHRVRYKKMALMKLQQQNLGIGTFCGHRNELVVTTSGVARRLGLIAKETLSHGHGHVSHREKLKHALQVRINSNLLKSAVSSWLSEHRVIMKKKILSIERSIFNRWKYAIQSGARKRDSMIQRLLLAMNLNSMAYGFKGLRFAVHMKKIGLTAERVLSSDHLRTWLSKTRTRLKLRAAVGGLVKGFWYTRLRLFFSFWKACAGAAMRSETVFFHETVFRRWRCCFVARRHYKMSLISMVFDDWSRLVFGRLTARHNIRRGRRIAAKLLTKIRQQRCSTIRVFFNRWATQAEVPLPGLRLKANPKKQSLNKAILSRLAANGGNSHALLLPETSEESKSAARESLRGWQTSIMSVRSSSSLMSSSKRFTVQSVASYRDLAAQTVIRTIDREAAEREEERQEERLSRFYPSNDLASRTNKSSMKQSKVEFRRGNGDVSEHEENKSEHTVHDEHSEETETSISESMTKPDALSMSDLK